MQPRTMQYEQDKLDRQERITRAQKAQQARQLPPSNNKPGLYSMTMAQVGKALSLLGESLQERYNND